MQIHQLSKQHVTLKIVDSGPVIQGSVTDIDDGGIWLATGKDVWITLLGHVTPFSGGETLNIFVPFSSMAWLIV